jgi:hypothetical protein
MRNEGIDIDHIDPRWEEGRDYQKVCGFEKDPKNLREEDSSRNQSKSNRFLPWRWTRDDLGVVPEEPGDLALFLDPDTDEWVLEEFMGEWWFEKTWRNCGPCLGLKAALDNDPEVRKKTFKRILESNPDHQKEAFQKLLEKKPNHQSEAGKLGGKKIHERKDQDGKSIRAKELGRMGCKEKKGKVGKRNYANGVGIASMTAEERSEHSRKTSQQRYIDPCHPELGAHSAPTLALIQKARGLPHNKENRVRVS